MNGQKVFSNLCFDPPYKLENGSNTEVKRQPVRREANPRDCFNVTWLIERRRLS